MDPAHPYTKYFIALIIHKFHHNNGTPDPAGQILILLKMFCHDIEHCHHIKHCHHIGHNFLNPWLLDLKGMTI